MNELPSTILIINLGSPDRPRQIQEILNSMGIHSIIIHACNTSNEIFLLQPLGTIIVGEARSVSDAPRSLDLLAQSTAPLLGLGDGMIWLAKQAGASIGNLQGARPEMFSVHANSADPIFNGLAEEQTVWSRHHEFITVLPSELRTIATRPDSRHVAGFSSLQRRWWGLRFHPEDPRMTFDHPACPEKRTSGKQIFENFVYNICGHPRPEKVAASEAAIDFFPAAQS